MAMKEDLYPPTPHASPQSVTVDANAPDAQFKTQVVTAIALSNQRQGSMERGLDRLTDLVTEGFEGIRAHQRKQDERLASQGMVSSQQVVERNISVIKTFIAAVTLSVSLISIIGGLVIVPLVKIIEEEIKDRKALEIRVNGTEASVSEMKSDIKGVQTVMGMVQEYNNLIDLYQQGQIDALRNLHIRRVD